MSLAVLGAAFQRECAAGRLERTFTVNTYSPSCCTRSSSYFLKADVADVPFDLNGTYMTIAPATKPDMEQPKSTYILENAMTLITRNYYISPEAWLTENDTAAMLEAAQDGVGTLPEPSSGSGAFDSAVDEVGSKSWCRAHAEMLNATFTTQEKSNGAPAGCLLLNENRGVVHVATCTEHVNCGTLKCDGCSVLAIEADIYPYVNLEYSNYPVGYPSPLEPGVTNLSIGGNQDESIYNTYAHPDGKVLVRIYSDNCPFPPSAPPPPPVEALCIEGTWPLFEEQDRSNSLSPKATSHMHDLYGKTYYMPDGFPGAQHAGERVFCPAHSIKFSPFAPPSPLPPPTPPSPPPPGDPPSEPPPFKMAPVASALLIFLIPAGVLVLFCVAILTWMLHWREPELRGVASPPQSKAKPSRAKFDAI